MIPDDMDDATNEAALLPQASLGDWNRPEEDAAWSYLPKICEPPGFAGLARVSLPGVSLRSTPG